MTAADSGSRTPKRQIKQCWKSWIVVVSVLRKRNCLCGRSSTKSVAQSTPVATTSLLPPLKVRRTNGGVPLYKFAYRSTRRRRSNHGQSICVAGRCAVLPRFSEHWRPWHSSDLRQRRTARASTFVSSGVRRRHFSGAWCLRYFLSYLRSSSSTPITRFRCCTLSWPGKQLHCIKASSKSCAH